MLTHQLDVKGSWIVIPLFTYLSDNYSNVKWYFFCLENTVVKLSKLLNVFSQFNSSQVNNICLVIEISYYIA